jgi:hypothetical protein
MKKHYPRHYKKTQVGKYTLVEHSSSTCQLTRWALPGGGILPHEKLVELRAKVMAKAN